jgi:hypothetical protein
LDNLFTTPPKIEWIKAHNGHDKNEEVDLLAQEAARQATTPTILFNNSSQKFLFKNAQIISEYPTANLKKQSQTQINQETINYLSKKANNPAINLAESIKILQQGIDQINPLDATNHREHAFRINLLTQSLPLLTKVSRWNSVDKIYTHTKKCPRCSNTGQQDNTEDHTHLFLCKKNTSALYHQACKTIEQRLHNTKKYEQLKESARKPTAKKLLYLLGVRKPFRNFLQSPEANGYITTPVLQRFQEKAAKSNTKQWLQLTMDSWLSTVHKHIWKPRCTALRKAKAIATPPRTVTKITLHVHKRQRPTDHQTDNQVDQPPPKRIKLKLNPPSINKLTPNPPKTIRITLRLSALNPPKRIQIRLNLPTQPSEATSAPNSQPSPHTSFPRGYPASTNSIPGSTGQKKKRTQSEATEDSKEDVWSQSRDKVSAYQSRKSKKPRNDQSEKGSENGLTEEGLEHQNLTTR